MTKKNHIGTKNVYDLINYIKILEQLNQIRENYF